MDSPLRKYAAQNITGVPLMHVCSAKYNWIASYARMQRKLYNWSAPYARNQRKL
jgi:hypothetical protein